MFTQLNIEFTFGRKVVRTANRLKFLIFIIVVCVSSFCVAKGQTLIMPLWADRGILLRDQLWNFSLINPSDTYTGKIEIIVSEASSGIQIFSALSKDILIEKGSKVVGPVITSPANYTILSTVYNFNPVVNSILPPGIFNVCYTVYRYYDVGPRKTAEECKLFESDPLSPPYLIMPEENAEISAKRPFFSWLPPVPNNSLPRLNYSLKVVVKDRYQSSQEAMDRNIPLFTQGRILQNSFNYPINIPELDTGKVYAWQVIAYNENNYVGTSEAWEFRFKTDSIIYPKPPAHFYIPLIKAGSSQIINVQDELKLSYNNEANDSMVVLLISKQSSSGKSVSDDIPYSIALAPGVNNLTINVSDFDQIKNNTLYEAFLLNSRQERWWISFKLVRSK